MKHFKLLAQLSAAGLLVLCSLNGHAQESITFTVNQPDSPLSIDAGPDQTYDGSSTIVLGGEPSAVGGFGEYTYQWEPAAYLDDATLANPTVIYLDGPTTFSLTVSDPGALCNKVAEVHVGSILSAAHAEAPEARLFPNPFVEAVSLESNAAIERVQVTDMAGQVIAIYSNLQSGNHRLETAPLAMGMYFFIIRFADGSTSAQKLCKIH